MKWSGRIRSWSNLRHAYYFEIFMEELWKTKENLKDFQSPVPSRTPTHLLEFHAESCAAGTLLASENDITESEYDNPG